MILCRIVLLRWRPTVALLMTLLAGILAPAAHAQKSPSVSGGSRMQKRWLFVWRNMSDPKEVDRMIARFPRAHAAGYNGVAFSSNIPEAKADELRQAAKQNGLSIIAIVMNGSRDRNNTEGLLSENALFVAQGGKATHQPDNPTRVLNSDFEDVTDNHFKGWSFQDDEGVTTFADHEVTHGGKTALRMESIGKNEARHCRISQPIKLQPHRQYHISVWVKSENLTPADPEVKVLTTEGQGLSFQTFHTQKTQDWTQYDLAFNSQGSSDARLYLGSWGGKDGKVWWDDLRVEEIGLVNVLRRPGCPVTVRGEKSGTVYEEGRDYQKIVDPNLHPWQAYHEPPVIKLTPATRITEAERLRVSYYHPLIVYEDRLTSCLSEPKIFDEWREEVARAKKLLQPAAFLMSHDELRVMNQCALCQSKKMTPGELLAWNVHEAAQIIRETAPGAEIWVWNDMFDPQHNAVDHFYAVNGSLTGSWEGLDKNIGIVNWYGSLMGKNCQFFADRGIKQILSGYYDGDETGSGIARWLANTQQVPGIVGAMYTTWEDRYDALGTWAQKAWGSSIAPGKPGL